MSLSALGGCNQSWFTSRTPFPVQFAISLELHRMVNLWTVSQYRVASKKQSHISFFFALLKCKFADVGRLQLLVLKFILHFRMSLSVCVLIWSDGTYRKSLLIKRLMIKASGSVLSSAAPFLSTHITHVKLLLKLTLKKKICQQELVIFLSYMMGHEKLIPLLD